MLWDVGEQRCVASHAMHADSVWAVQASPAFDAVFSAGRDGRVFHTPLRPGAGSTLLVHEDAPVVAVRCPPAAGV